MERMLNANEVSILVGCTVNTLTLWYKWKQENPNNEMAKMLPNYIRKDSQTRGKRLWKYSDIPQIIEFRSNIKQGCNGFMGSVTQRYKKTKKEK